MPLRITPARCRLRWKARKPRAMAATPLAAPAITMACMYPPRPVSLRQRIGAQLEVYGDGLLAFTAFHEPRRPVAAGRPQPPALPAGVRVVDASVEPLGVEAQRVGDA